jgi:hypothetical protein
MFKRKQWMATQELFYWFVITNYYLLYQINNNHYSSYKGKDINISEMCDQIQVRFSV